MRDIYKKERIQTGKYKTIDDSETIIKFYRPDLNKYFMRFSESWR